MKLTFPPKPSTPAVVRPVLRLTLSGKPDFTEHRIIVLATADMSGREETGNWERFNGNYYPEFVAKRVVKALVWLNEGTAADVAKAERYAAQEGYTVLTFPLSERNPLEAARAALA